jgi:3-oxoacyl-(acyl-carrier-protein) synthase
LLIATPTNRVVITGVGYAASPILSDALAGRLSAPPATPPEITGFEIPEGQPTWGFEALDVNIEQELPSVKSFIDRTSALAMVTAKYALKDAGLLDRARPNGDEVGCAYGSMLGCLEAMGIFWNKVKTSNPKFAPPLPFTHGYANSPSSLLCIEYGLRGAAATFSGEKLAGLEAVMFAADQVASGAARFMLAGASESLTPAGWRHLLATGQLSPTGKWDDGIIPGEGGAMLVLESDASARARHARIYAEVEGINFFSVDPASAGDPISVGTGPEETVNFVSGPNLLPSGQRVHLLRTNDMAAVATKLYTGDMLSVSPVLGVALAAGTLSGSVRVALQKGGSGMPMLQEFPRIGALKYSVATGFDPAGRLGTVMLKRYQEVSMSGQWPRVVG